MDGTLVEDYGYHENGARCSDITGNSYLYEEDDRLISAGGTEYVFDIDGFLDTKTVGNEVTDYTYSSRGELLEVGLPDGRTLEYTYDPLGRRIAKLEDGTIVEKYLWQGMTRLLAVYDGTDSMTMRFEYADARMPFAMTCEGATFYLAYDQVGSLRIIADESGAIVKQIDYDSFGNILSKTDESGTVIPIPFGFAGGLHDRDTGLVRFGYRDYNPETGRWCAKDPIFFSGGDTDLFGYCFDDPVNGIDPSGLVDLNLFDVMGDDALTHSAMEKYTPPVGDFSVAAHGLLAGFTDDRSGTRIFLGVEGAAKVIRGGGWKEGQSIALAICGNESADFDKFMQDLANNQTILPSFFGHFSSKKN